MKIFEKGKNKLISEIVIIAVIFGFGAGIVGQIVADVYINPWETDFLGSNLNTNQNISISQIPELKRIKRFLGIEQDFEVNKSVQKVMPATVGIYLKKLASNSTLNQIYLASELRGSAFVLTSDGWLVTHSSVIGKSKQGQLAVVYNNKVFTVDKTITDSMAGIVFLKITADNLPVVILGDSDEATLGQLTIALNASGQVAVTNIKETNFQLEKSTQNLIMSTDSFSNLILLQDMIGTEFLGSPVINLGGEVIGVISDIDTANQIVTVTPLNQFRIIILGVLRDNLIKRPYLGIDYLDLTRSAGLTNKTSQGLDKGALVYSNPSRISPAADVEIKKNDIILSVDGQLVDANNNLTELIQQYQPGDEVELEIAREGSRIVKKVTLSLLAD